MPSTRRELCALTELKWMDKDLSLRGRYIRRACIGVALPYPFLIMLVRHMVFIRQRGAPVTAGRSSSRLPIVTTAVAGDGQYVLMRKGRRCNHTKSSGYTRLPVSKVVWIRLGRRPVARHSPHPAIPKIDRAKVPGYGNGNMK
jgi:hypothetical protein